MAFLTEDAFGSWSTGLIPLSGQGAAFAAASTAFVVDIVLSIGVSLVTQPKPASELVGLVYSETPKWWTEAGRPSHLPPQYDRALRDARRDAGLAP